MEGTAQSWKKMVNRKALMLPLVLWSILVPASGVYVDHSNPYQSGPLPTTRFTLTKTDDHSPMHTNVAAPTTPGDYALAFFVPGFDGVLPSIMYQRYLNDVAKHGFIVSSSDYIWPALSKRRGSRNKNNLEFISKTYEEQFAWLKNNLQRYLSTFAPNVTCNFDHVGLFSHSAGGDTVFKMAKRNHTSFKGIVFYEPMSFEFKEATNFSLPALIVGTQLSTIKKRECIIPGYGYNHFYDMWSAPPKILMDVEHYGHCDILDNPEREFCTNTMFCFGGNSTSIPAYHSFAQGVTSSFLIASVQGLPTDFRFVSERSNVPLPLDVFKTDMNYRQH